MNRNEPKPKINLAKKTMTVIEYMSQSKRGLSLKAIARGVCNFFGVAYIAEEAEEAPAPQTLYRVQAGAFASRFCCAPSWFRAAPLCAARPDWHRSRRPR